ncbi:uncharacterized protein IWZ02DRAFT_407739, partial [Phyllosticta citriasiana]|uniref:uncharacterized protein n=1 Tax=Phyllosticta citriasiana TaxID=595635 RepID=UPI0030FD44E8
MAQIAMPQQPVPPCSTPADMGSSLYQRRKSSAVEPIELIPNPHFVFPAPAPGDSQASSSRRPSSLQALPDPVRAQNTRDKYKRRSASALPDFSFSPASQGGLAAPTTTTPPLTPTSTSPTNPSRHSIHKRGASEYIGGRGGRSSGTVVPMSASPTRLEAPSSGALQPASPAGRRGHAHRRSGAISSHDLSFLLQPKNQPPPIPRIENVPATPAESVSQPSPQPAAEPLAPAIVLSGSSEDLTKHQESSDLSQNRPPSRARVGFSETVEFIRPLSTISSETESTMSTVRAHSVSDSLSSVMSGPSSPQGIRWARPPTSNPTTVPENTVPRPSTAGAMLDFGNNESTGFDCITNDSRPRSAILPDSAAPPPFPGNSAPSNHFKKRSFFWTEQRHSDSSIVPATNNSDSSISIPSDSPVPSSAEPSPVAGSTDGGQTSAARKGFGKKPRKVKSWATSIISRKAKRHGSKLKDLPRRGSTPTLPSQSSLHFDDQDHDLDVSQISPNFDVDDTVTIVTPTATVAPARPKVNTSLAAWQPKEFLKQDADIMSPVIDLDAALGPFNTPTIGPVPRSRNRGPSALKRPMHSSMGTFGIASHRRAESAPELVPFELRSAPMTGATTPMADVFEEEEEDDESPITLNAGKLTTALSSVAKKEDDEKIDEAGSDDSDSELQAKEPEAPQSELKSTWNFEGAFGASSTLIADAANHSPKAKRAVTPVSPGSKPFLNAAETSPGTITEDRDDHSGGSSTTRTSESTIMPKTGADITKEHDSPKKVQESASGHVATPDSLSPPTEPFRKGSFDVPRIGTASSSSITDGRPANFGEPGPDYRVSVDDVPSLTSSRSTMTSAAHANFPYIVPHSPGDRTASVSSVSSIPIESRRKRASIASLSRLVGSSFGGERSKLSVEQRPQSEHSEKVNEIKSRKHKRLSKMMSFWKPKESS